MNPAMNIPIQFVDFHDETLLKSAIDTRSQGSTSKSNRLLWLETPTNPTLKISDIHSISKIAHANDCLLAVDNTFCSPYFQSPLDLGADLVVHSVTKYINGHSDVVMGVVCTNNDELYKKLRFIQNGVGAVPSPFDCYLAHRGLKTLHLRMEASARTAMAIALFLEQHPSVSKVLYPGLPSHPQHELAKHQQHGFGAMITFYCVGKRENSAVFLQNVSACFPLMISNLIAISLRLNMLKLYDTHYVTVESICSCRVAWCSRIFGRMPISHDSC